jgi:hypothetical protein
VLPVRMAPIERSSAVCEVAALVTSENALDV